VEDPETLELAPREPSEVTVRNRGNPNVTGRYGDGELLVTPLIGPPAAADRGAGAHCPCRRHHRAEPCDAGRAPNGRRLTATAPVTPAVGPDRVRVGQKVAGRALATLSQAKRPHIMMTGAANR
jgi:hypothetical protein